MTTYVDASALLKRYVEEFDSDIAQQFMAADPVLVTSWVTVVEVRRNLPRLIEDQRLLAAQAQLTADLDAFAMIACDEVTAQLAANIGETLGVRSLDAVHLASAQRLQVTNLVFLTFDLRQAQAARSLGFIVRGA